MPETSVPPDKSPATLLGDLLRQARLKACLSGAAAGRQAQMGQSKISKLERARLAPTPYDVTRLLRVYGAEQDEITHAVQLARAVTEETRRRSRFARLDRRDARLFEAEATVLRVLALTGVDAVPQTRAGRTVHLLVPEWVAGREDQRVLLDQAARLPDVHVGILPNHRIPQGGSFRIVDESVVMLEMLTDALVLKDHLGVTVYLERFAALCRDAVDAMGEETKAERQE
ncbi:MULTISPECIES: helix-turn-helix transcriptional regulator [Actinosynnema]|uniref:helix-turn-helix domain-containing protein n=1 Tax=Actinosynnema TaxID=40566 RepID=UPI0020A2B7E9|nr:helix-turn-helix transcriptional regulator [Actinosynnema pretiosum]MCP2092691.1 Helix-turn-helix domain-containing protein [Actinosynnema pretiosum]